MKKTYLLLPALLLAGCRSEQLALQSSPPAATAATASASPASADSATALVTMPAPAGVGPGAGRASLARRGTRQARQLPRPVPAAAGPLAVATAPVPARPRLLQRLALRKMATAGPAHTAENGLGRTVLFLLAVVLVLLAGLAALVNLIFSVGFFTALGYTVAGLVVLFLLYSLLSGGKKKPKPTTK